MPNKEWIVRVGLSLIAIAAFWTGRWVNLVDDAIVHVNQQEVRIVLLEEVVKRQEQISKQQLAANLKFAEALDDFRRMAAAKR